MGLVSTDLQLRFKRPCRGLEVVQSGFTSGIGLFESDNLASDQKELSYESLVRLGAAHLADKNLLEMSQGEQRRCLLARALVHDPDFLILDEPTNNLDLKATFELLAEMRGLVGQGRTLVLVTHNPDEILPEIEHAVLLARGEVAAAGPKQELITADRLSSLFETPIALLKSNGYYRAVPAGS
jgi:iron complex transport system ATP-binding protein